MRKKMDQEQKRGSLIGIKVKEETKKQLQFISEREARPMSTQINIILESYINKYFKEQKLNWDEWDPSRKEE